MEYLDQIKKIYVSLKPFQRRIIAGVMAALVFALLGIVYWANTESYEVIYASNDLSRVRAAAQSLEEAGIPYKISADGTQLVSESENLGRARIVTAGTDAVTGMEVLGTIQLGSSPQHERWVYINALQGELTRTINNLEEVAASRIHIVEPERSSFFNRSNQASASITVQLHPGRRLTNGQIKGITSLVAGAVKGLAASQVVLVDETGKFLSGPQEDEGGGAVASNLMEARQHHESHYRKTILGHLSRILGSVQHVSVAVTVDVVTETRETSVKSLDPNSQVTISEKINESSSKEANATGIPGAESNLPEQAPAGEEGNAQEKFQSATNYEYTRKTEISILPPGSPERASVSVMVNSLALDELVRASNGSITVDALKKQIEDSVQSSIGYSKARGDIASVSFVPFSVPEATSGLIPDSFNLKDYMSDIIIILTLFLFFIVLVRPIVGSIQEAVRSSGGPGGKLWGKSPEELAAIGALDENSSRAMAYRIQGMVDNFETIDSKELNKLVEVHEQPSAEVIRRWIRAM